MDLGNLHIEGFAALAPMAGVADRAMREVCRSFGAAYTVSELISAKGISLNDKKSQSLMEVHKKECPMGIQLFGSDPEVMSQAARKAELSNPDFIDINMGCPAPKVAGNGGGSALLKDLPLAEKITEAVVKSVSLPVTVKIRIGWDGDNYIATELAKRCENAGAVAITVHGRTRMQMYAPPVNYDIIKDVKESVKIPVIANGDIDSPQKAKFVYDYTGCDFIMIGRAAMGAPWIFREVNEYLQNGTLLPPLTLEEKLNILKNQIKLMEEYKDRKIAYLEARKHTAWYLKGVRGAAALRRQCGEIKNMDDVERICEAALESL